MSTIKHRVVEIWKGFLTDTSLHGLQYLTHKHKHLLTRCVWFLLVSGSFAILIHQLFGAFQNFMKNDFSTKTNLVFQSEFEYPAITLCNAHSFDQNKLNKSSVLYEYLKTKFSFGRPQEFSSSKWNEKPSIQDLESMLFNISNFVGYMLENDNRVFSESLFQQTYRKPLNPCVTYNGQWLEKLTPKMSNVDGSLILYLNLYQDRYGFPVQTAEVHLCVHPSREPVDVNTPCALLSPGNHYEVKLSMIQLTYLPAPYYSYQNLDCEDAGRILTMEPLKYFPYYTYPGCLIECLSDYVIRACGCVTEFLVDASLTQPMCSFFQRETCVQKLVVEFYGDSTAANNLTSTCNCPRSCSRTVYDAKLSAGIFPANSFMDVLRGFNLSDDINHARNNLLMIRITLKNSMVEQVIHVPAMSSSDLISNIGGLMGFFAGASLMTGWEILVAILQTVTAFITAKFNMKTESSTKIVPLTTTNHKAPK